jgi:hypothetical protein
VRRGALLAAVLLVASCGGDGDEDEEAATTTVAPTTTAPETTTTAAPDPFVVPDDPADIDEAYVEAVLRELERINGDALRLAVSEGLSPRITELIESIYEPSLAGDQLELLARSAGEGFPGTSRPPGDVIASVNTILVARLDCVSADANYDFTAVADGAASDVALRVELRPSSPDASSNGTPWVYFMRDALEGSQELPVPCAE